MSYEAANHRWWAIRRFTKTLVKFGIIDKTYRHYMTDEYYYRLNPY
ncbi:hypothetical protein UFOVP53_102 [uncultured Caudovirales phage]|uniref:Uncharacterized protein n=1 Tax=uncultured Caudovirales phage TaxID=2100421 RepID=A0A6J5KS74_9CAUD|nr:hypothetical protein UFOVP53_102 [uncultured Caudovirales phage]